MKAIWKDTIVAGAPREEQEYAMSERLDSIVLAGGCFWCLDAEYRLVKGVKSVTSGYSGGDLENPTADQVYEGNTGHAEAVKVDFDPAVISLETLLDIFWTMHDPTTLNRQGYDIGTEYRSAIFYRDDTQKITAEKSKEAAKKVWGNNIVTEINKLKAFYPAEDYNQNFFEKHPEKAYCQIIINPKLKKLRKKFSELMVQLRS